MSVNWKLIIVMIKQNVQIILEALVVNVIMVFLEMVFIVMVTISLFHFI